MSPARHEHHWGLREGNSTSRDVVPFPKFYFPEATPEGSSWKKDWSPYIFGSGADRLSPGSLFQPWRRISKKKFEFCFLRSPDFITYIYPSPNTLSV